MMRVHATCVALAGRGVLLRGEPGAGKSDLALRLMDGGALLVADDQTEIRRDGRRLLAKAPESLAGLIEVRGLGLIEVPFAPFVELHLVIDLVERAAVPRMPEPEAAPFLGLSLPLFRLAPFEASAAAKVRLALTRPPRDIVAPS
ncbi:MAG: HPr kinase/phosphatase C-terminal domain-containing protein [Alphaproteobacteria bacterium]|nr:HPr kinase/phosphatase C-terminal domain-containing protein [Alphaproteobacteria bacterium]